MTLTLPAELPPIHWPTGVIIGVAAGVGALALGGVGLKYGGSASVCGSTSSQEEEEDNALARLRRVARGPVAGVTEIRVSTLQQQDPTGEREHTDLQLCSAAFDGEAVAVCPDRHLCNEQKKLLLERLVASMGDTTARGVVFCKQSQWQHDPYPTDHCCTIRSALLEASAEPVVTDDDDGGIANVQIIDDGYYVSFNEGIRLTLAQKFVIIRKFRDMIPKRMRVLRITLMDDAFREEQSMGTTIDDMPYAP